MTPTMLGGYGSGLFGAGLFGAGEVITSVPPRQGIDVRLVAYEPDGTRLGVLPYPLGINVGLPLDDVPALTLTYSDLAAGGYHAARGLEEGLEIAVEHAAAAGWVEPDGCRFILLERTDDPTDEAGTRKLTLPSYAWMLRKMRLLSTVGLDVDGKRPFTSATAGTILATLIAEAQARGTVPGLGVAFTATHDSAGQPWALELTIAYALGTDLWTILENLTAQGVCDWTVRGRTLRAFNPDTALAPDLSVGGDPVILRLGRDVVDAPQTEKLTDVVSVVMIRGEAGLTITETNPTAPTPWGGWEGYISQGGVSDEGTALTLVQGELERGGRVRGQYTRTLTFDRAQWLPLVDYTPGAYVLAPGAAGTLERLRVRQITLTRDGAGVVGGNVVLRDRFVEADLRRARRLNGIVGGATADGGTGAVPADGPDRRTPAAPTGLVVQSFAYLDPAGTAQGQITATWNPVTTATDLTAVEVVAYQVWMRDDNTEAPWRQVATVEATTVDYSPLPVGTSMQVAVRAVGRYTTVPGQMSVAVVVLIAVDTTAPPVPSVPVATTRLGTISVAWDGLPGVGVGMPADFDRVEVAMGAAPEPVDVVATLTGPGRVIITGQPYAQARWFRLRAVDRSGNASAWSTEAGPIATVPLVDTDLIGEIISGAHIVDGTLVASEKVVAGSVTTATLAALAVTAGEIAANAVTADKIDAGAVEADKIDAGAVTAVKLAADAITADKIQAGAVTAVKIAADAITADKIAANAITADKIQAGAVTAATIAADAITGKTITGGTITGTTLAAVRIDATSYIDIGSARLTGYGTDLNCNGGFRTTGDSSLGLVSMSLTSTTGTANVYSSGSGATLARTSSLSRFKLDQRRIPVDYSILELLPLTWRDLAMVDADPATRVRVAGFVAEHVAALSATHGGAFDALLVLDEDGNVQGLAYDRVLAYVLPVVADMNARLQALERRRLRAAIRRIWARATTGRAPGPRHRSGRDVGPPMPGEIEPTRTDQKGAP